jgi:hypothetical protein
MSKQNKCQKWNNVKMEQTNKKKIPDGVIGFFLFYISSYPTISLGSTQPLIEISTGSISCV